ncbi:TolC family outer membrane protein [Piscinibacter gummiphilus]|uniref:TolC family outer membrane protein n=1 Tax=Piscinibacter gummiphilus TaxID=946333 RepID=A0ABZ0CN73_9BURK|nr:TolC family outer membrane protein [Piscinibacter gummiphilus]WOB06422.1 TolC family outer membrane protein [Piscinibacter gummiphilus]
MHFKTRALTLALTLAFTASASAQSNEALKAAAQQAINTNPDVTARFNAYRAAADAVDAARGGYFPRLDLSASAGRDRDRIDSRTPQNQSISRSGASLTLSQLLWDGLATQNEVGRLGHEKLARYFELLDATEQTALEAARAYYDVLRYRRLVQLAEDSYVQHKSAFNQIQSRFRAGVGRGVDLEQAGARLALAESNLSTELSNLHDVSARYQRVVGVAPPKAMPLPLLLKDGVPASANEASLEAARRSPAVSASIETLRATKELLNARESAYQPKVEARLRSGTGKNFDGVRDQRTDSTAEIVLNWNLFNGGSDRARVRQQANLVNQAADQRDKACRDARQVLAIAYNDTKKLADQLIYLDRNTLAIEKARDAYRQQFDIGQRSLLDLLNSENELYTARRSYANAEFDLGIAYARVQAALNRLNTQLGLRSDREAPQGTENWSAGDEGPGRCPLDAIEVQPLNLDELDRRAASLTQGTPQPSATARNPAAPALRAESAPVKASAPVLPSEPTAASVNGPTALSVRRLNEWAAAWEAKDIDRYLAFYAPDFRSELGDAESWKNQRRRLVTRKGEINVKLEEVLARELAPDRVETQFKQSYRSEGFKDVMQKSLIWQQIGGQWLIVKESNR